MDVRKLIRLREYTGTVRFETQADRDSITVPLANIPSPVSAEGEYEIYEDDAVEIRGKVRYLLQGACSRCLRDTQSEISAEWNPLFVNGEADGESYSYRNGVIDFADSVREAVLLGMPFCLLCADCEREQKSSDDDGQEIF